MCGTEELLAVLTYAYMNAHDTCHGRAETSADGTAHVHMSNKRPMQGGGGLDCRQSLVLGPFAAEGDGKTPVFHASESLLCDPHHNTTRSDAQKLSFQQKLTGMAPEPRAGSPVSRSQKTNCFAKRRTALRRAFSLRRRVTRYKPHAGTEIWPWLLWSVTGSVR